MSQNNTKVVLKENVGQCHSVALGHHQNTLKDNLGCHQESHKDNIMLPQEQLWLQTHVVLEIG